MSRGHIQEISIVDEKTINITVIYHTMIEEFIYFVCRPTNQTKGQTYIRGKGEHYLIESAVIHLSGTKISFEYNRNVPETNLYDI